MCAPCQRDIISIVVSSAARPDSIISSINGAGTAQIGSVASALRYVAKEVIMGIDRKSASKSAGHLKARLVNGGIGEPLITEFLADVPDVNESTVKQHLAILKASGDYGRITAPVSAATCRR
jgi:hypothetical protein